MHVTFMCINMKYILEENLLALIIPPRITHKHLNAPQLEE